MHLPAASLFCPEQKTLALLISFWITALNFIVPPLARVLYGSRLLGKLNLASHILEELLGPDADRFRLLEKR